MGASERDRAMSSRAAVDALRLVTAATADDYALEREIVGELLDDQERIELALISLASMVGQVAAQIARRRGVPVVEVLADMMDGAYR